jgi:MraZ protein
MFTGEFEHSVDSKNRIFVPAKFREELGESFMVVRDIRGPILKLYSLEEWEKYLAPIRAQERRIAEKALRYLHRNAAQVSPDSLVRVLLTKGLLDFAKIEADEAGNRNVVIVGCGDFGEIWSEELYNKHVSEMDIDEIRRSLEESGL